MKLILILTLSPMMVFAAQRHIPSTKERAAGMFRTPSGSKAGKIERKFQPIDHVIKGTSSPKK